MIANNYLNNGHTHTEVVELLVLGSTEKLLSWWDKYLTEDSRELIKHVVKQDDDGNPIFDEHLGRGTPNGVNSLIYTIMDHFIEPLVTSQLGYMTN